MIAKGVAAALRKAGCTVRGPNVAQTARARTSIYSRGVEDPTAASFARAFDGDVAALTWDTPADVVIALGAS